MLPGQCLPTREPKPASEAEVWFFGQVRTEARECLKIANANGGTQKMRELIGISPRELQQLEKFVSAFPELRLKIERAIAFREAVLQDFELHVSGTERPVEEILAKPVTAAEREYLIASLLSMSR